METMKLGKYILRNSCKKKAAVSTGSSFMFCYFFYSLYFCEALANKALLLFFVPSCDMLCCSVFLFGPFKVHFERYETSKLNLSKTHSRVYLLHHIYALQYVHKWQRIVGKKLCFKSLTSPTIS